MTSRTITGNLTADEVRALRILSRRDAHELVDRPLEVLGRLVPKGLAQYGPQYSTPKHGKARSISITPAGRLALKETQNAETQ